MIGYMLIGCMLIGCMLIGCMLIGSMLIRCRLIRCMLIRCMLIRCMLIGYIFTAHRLPEGSGKLAKPSPEGASRISATDLISLLLNCRSSNMSMAGTCWMRNRDKG